jgi:hypothetical protein
MRLDQAMKLNVGDKVVNCFMDELIISKIDNSYPGRNDPKPPVFIALDSELQKHYLWFDEIYHPDLADICDEEKSFIMWAKDNREFIGENTRLLKTVYMQGFAIGFEFKRAINAQEQLQK